MNAYITREPFVFTVFRRVLHSTLKLELSTSRSNYFDMSIWKKHADHSTSNCGCFSGPETTSRRQVTCAHRSGVQKRAQLEKTMFLINHVRKY